MKKHTFLEQLPRVALLYILAVLTTSTALLYTFTPVWVSAVVWVCIMWRLFIFVGKLSFPPPWLKMLLVFFLTAGAFWEYRYSFSIDLFASILMLGFSLRVLEVYHKQGAQMLLYLAIFVLMTYLLYEQTFLAGLLAFTQMLLIVAALIAINSDITALTKDYFQPIQKSIIVLFIAFPLMVVVFLLMPRLPPLWIMPLQTQQAKTGVSEQMSPGDISRLANSSELAFRATFIGKIPPKNELYWQAFVFDEFDGRQWKHNCDCNYSWVNSSTTTLPDSIQNSVWHYQIMLEPHGNRWLFVLPSTIIRDNRIRNNGDNLFRTRREVVDRIVYEGMVFNQTPKNTLGTVEFKRDTQLPPVSNPKARELATQWRKTFVNDWDIVQQALTLYRSSMRYTLAPPVLGENSIDDFLFITKAGFCEHFASSFVFLMRAAGIPARVIVGYQGGEINQQGNYVIVRQYDAHAWAQVWLPGQGWVKVDPTSAVDPSRIDGGFETAFANSPVLNSPLNLQAYRNINLINLLRINIDYMNYAWSRWVVGYNAELQNKLLSKAGLNSPWRIFLLIAAIFTSLLMLFGLFLLINNRYKKRELPLTNRYRQLSGAYINFGLKRQLSETPLQFAKRVQDNCLPYSHRFMLVSKQYNDWVCVNESNGRVEFLLKYEFLFLLIRLKVIGFIKKIGLL